MSTGSVEGTQERLDPTGMVESEGITNEALKAAAAAFQENVDQTELKIGRLSICQGTTKEISGQVAGYELGMIISTATRNILSKKMAAPWLVARGVQNAPIVHCLPIIPVMKLPTEFIEIIPKNEQKEGELFYRYKSLNRKEQRVLDGTYVTKGGNWGKKPEHKDTAPPITECINFLVLPFSWETKEMIEGFQIATFSKTSNPTGGKLTTETNNRYQAHVLPWDSVYWLYTSPKPTKKGTTQIYNIAWGGLVKEICPDLHSMAQNQAIQLSTIEGKQMQEYILNAVDLTADHEESEQTLDTTATDVTNAASEADEAFGTGGKEQNF